MKNLRNDRNFKLRALLPQMIRKLESRPKRGFSPALALFLVFAFSALPLWAESGRSVMKRVQQQSRKHKTTESDIYMLILDAKKRKRKRYFSNKRKIKASITNSIVKFYKPASVKGTGLLTVSNEKTSRNKQWIYFPSLRSLKQLSSGDKNKSFMGSDFSNADIAGRELDRDKHTLKKTEGDFHYIVSVPKDKSEPYSRLEVKVHRKINVVTQVIFYNRKGKKLKTLENLKIKKVKGMYMVVYSVMKNHISKGKTSLEVSGIKVGHNIPDNDVAIKGLRN